MMKYVIGILFVLAGFFASAQPDDAVVKTIEGKKYYVHTVAAGNTLYGIHKLYKTDLEDILNANPGLTDDLAIGQQVLIPIDTGNTEHYNTHIVAEGETLYGISRKYGCTVNELKNLNEGIENGLQIGQEIKIPKPDISPEVIQDDPEADLPEYEISYSDSIVYHTVLPHETLYAISKRYMVSADTIRALNDIRGDKVKKGDVLKIPVKKVNYEVLEKQIEDILEDTLKVVLPGVHKDVYKVALMLPFMLTENDAEMNKSLRFGEIREMHPTTKIAFEFYQGFVLAADSLKKAGVNLDIYVYDTKKDTNAIAKILNTEEFKDMDLVVGPLYKNTIDYTVKQCANRGIRIVLPFKTQPAVLHGNPNVFKAVSSNMTLLDGSVDYILKHHAHHNVIILKPYLEGDMALFERARTRFNAGLTDSMKTYNKQIVELVPGSSSGRDLNAQINKDTVNIFIIPSNNSQFVTGALNRLNKVVNMNPYAKNLKIIVFGFEDWNKNNDIDVLHRNKLNQHYSTYRFVDFNHGSGKEFVKTFRKRTGVDPNVYSAQGFDIGMYFMSALYMYGTNFENRIGEHKMELVQNNFEFRSIAIGSGFENQNVAVVKYQDFELILCSR